MRTTATLTLIILLASTALAQPLTLVKDINPGVFGGIQSTSNAAVVGNTLYFNAVGTTLDEELWKTDGTEAGTVLVKDINAGNQGSQQEFFSVYKDQLYFTAFTPSLGEELWRTDDIEGAVLLHGDACPGTCDGASYDYLLSPMAEYKGQLVFQSKNPDMGSEPWLTDGTEAGTFLLKDVKPGPNFSNSNPYGFTVFNGMLYFAADSTQIGTELWVSDGTAAGTHLLKDINPGVFGNSEMEAPVVGPNGFYFWAKSASGQGAELWKSDGTTAGTALLKEIKSGSGSGQPPYVPLSNSAWLNDQLLFTADDGVAGAELWITDGTASGTQLLVDINTGSAGSSLNFLTTWNGKVYFRAKTAANGHELWVTDGTAAGTKMFKDINPGAGDGISPISAFPFVKPQFIVHEDKMYFTANNGSNGFEPWVTDGTNAGTNQVFDLNPGAMESKPFNFRVMGDFLFFTATPQVTGPELWKLFIGTSATKDQNHQLLLRLYPTYAPDGVFYLDYPAAETQTFDLRVFDATGRLQYHNSQSLTEPLRLSSLPAGTYFVRIANDAGNFITQKVIIGR